VNCEFCAADESHVYRHVSYLHFGDSVTKGGVASHIDTLDKDRGILHQASGHAKNGAGGAIQPQFAFDETLALFSSAR
jgi:hypothetical protein